MERIDIFGDNLGIIVVACACEASGGSDTNIVAIVCIWDIGNYGLAKHLGNCRNCSNYLEHG